MCGLQGLKALKNLRMDFTGCEALQEISSLDDLAHLQELQVVNLNFQSCRGLQEVSALLKIGNLARLSEVMVNLSNTSIHPEDDLLLQEACSRTGACFSRCCSMARAPSVGRLWPQRSKAAASRAGSKLRCLEAVVEVDVATLPARPLSPSLQVSPTSPTSPPRTFSPHSV